MTKKTVKRIKLPRFTVGGAGFMLIIGFAILTVVYIFKPTGLTLDLVTSSRVARIELADTDVSLGRHTIKLTKAQICGAIDPTSEHHRICGKRQELHGNFTGQLAVLGGTLMEVQYRAGGKSILISLSNTSHPGVLHDAAMNPMDPPLPSEILIHLKASDYPNGDVILAFRANRFVVGGIGRRVSSEDAPILTSGYAVVVDRGIGGDLIVVGERFQFSPGDIVEYCNRTDGNGDECSSAVGLLIAEANGLLFSARVPISNVYVRKFGTYGYEIRVPWWQRFVSEPIVMLVWASLGVIYFALSFREKLSRIRED